MSPQQRTAVFKPREPIGYPNAVQEMETATIQWVGQVTERLVASLRIQGIITNSPSPYNHTDWYVLATIGEQKFKVIVDWVPVGKEDYCFCALALQRGFFRRLLSPPVTDDQFRPIQAALDVGLRAMSVSDLRWLTDDEFRKLW